MSIFAYVVMISSHVPLCASFAGVVVKAVQSKSPRNSLTLCEGHDTYMYIKHVTRLGEAGPVGRSEPAFIMQPLFRSHIECRVRGQLDCTGLRY